MAASVSFNAATAFVALPVYVRIVVSPGPEELLRLVLLLQVVPSVLLLGVDALVARSSPRSVALYRAIVALLAGLSVARLVHAQTEFDIGFGIPISPTILKGGALVILSLLTAAALVLARQAIVRYFVMTAPAFVATTLAFMLVFVPLDPLDRAPSTDRPSRADPVFIIVFDELGRDVLMRGSEIDRERFPNISALASDSVWFTDATTPYGETCEAFPALLTGRPSGPGACRAFVLRDSEASVLRELRSLYTVSVYGGYLKDCLSIDLDLCHGPSVLPGRYPQELLLQHYLPLSVRVGPLGELFGRLSPFTREVWSEFMADIEPGAARGRVYFVHLLLPHSPFAYDADGRLRQSAWEYFYQGPDSDPRVYENYRRQVQYVDGLIGQFIMRLKERGLYETSTVIITGDHGPRALHPVAPALEGTAAEAPNIPLIIHAPGLGPARVANAYEHTDLPAIIRQLVGMSASAGGRSIIGGDVAHRQRTFWWAGHAYVRDDESRRWLLAGPAR